MSKTTGNTYSSTWVDIDGFGNSDLARPARSRTGSVEKLTAGDRASFKNPALNMDCEVSCHLVVPVHPIASSCHLWL